MTTMQAASAALRAGFAPTTDAPARQCQLAPQRRAALAPAQGRRALRQFAGAHSHRRPHSSSPSPRRGAAVRAQEGGGAAPGEVILQVDDLRAVIAESQKDILEGVSITVRAGEVHAIMGKNGSGKSTFSKVLVGHPDYEVTGGGAQYKGADLLEMEPEARSHAGLFLSFQSPVEVPGVNNVDFLRLACNARRTAQGKPELDPLEFYGFLSPLLEELNMDVKYLQRNVNEGFSGGEKKRNEILQLAVLDADLAILDEIDSGLDVDALRDVAAAVNALRKPHKAVLLITHYQRLLDYIAPDFVHIMENGKIVKTGDASLATELEAGGYAAVRS